MLAVGIANRHGLAGRVNALLFDYGRECLLVVERILLQEFYGSIREKIVHIVPFVRESIGYDVIVFDEVNLTNRFKIDSIDQKRHACGNEKYK